MLSTVSFKLIIEPLALLNLIGPIVNILSVSISHSIFPEPNIVVTVCNDSPSESIPLIFDVLAFVDALVCFSTKTVAARVSVFWKDQLPNDTRVTGVLVECKRCVDV